MLNKGNLNDLSNVIFHVRENDDWNVVHLDQLMEDKTIVVFGLPGAFTPTCSTQQLPGYEAMYDQFIEAGVDEIILSSDFGQTQNELIESMYRISEEVIPYFKDTKSKVA